jgi:hypothetical protein
MANILTNEKSLEVWELVVGSKYFLGIKEKKPIHQLKLGMPCCHLESSLINILEDM